MSSITSHQPRPPSRRPHHPHGIGWWTRPERLRGGLRLISGGVGLVTTASHVASVLLWFLAVYVVVVAVQLLVDRVWRNHPVATRPLTSDGL